MKITFPYILAKVRLQAKFKEAQEEGDSTVDGMPLEKAKRPSGALEILGAIYKQKGFRGWYQVSLTSRSVTLVMLRCEDEPEH